METKRILLVEDDVMIATGLVYALEKEGYAVTHSKNVLDAQSKIAYEYYDLAIIDMQLPDGTGFEVCGAAKTTGMSVIFLTVVDDEGNIVRAFESGADDYVTKPFRLRELLARVKRLISSNDDDGRSPLIQLGKVTIDIAAAKVYLGESLTELTALEYRLLLTFASNKGQILSRNQILDSIWDSAGNFVEDNTLTVYIKRLREKLGDAINIETVRGLGYRVDQ